MTSSTEPLRKRWPSGIAATANSTVFEVAGGAHEESARDAPHLGDLVDRAADDVLAVARHRQREHRVDVAATGRCERACRRPGTAGPRCGWGRRQGRPQTARRRAAPRCCTRRCPPRRCARCSSPPKVHSFAVPSSEPLMKRPPLGSTASARTVSVCASIGAPGAVTGHRRSSTTTLTGLVLRAGDNVAESDAATHVTWPVCPESVSAPSPSVVTLGGRSVVSTVTQRMGRAR